MITNFILTCLIIIGGLFVCFIILLFGMRFCKDDGELNTSSKQESLLKELLQSIPIWVKIIAILTTQFAVVCIINVWFPTWMNNHSWIMNFSSCIGFISGLAFAIIILATNDNDNKHIQQK